MAEELVAPTESELRASVGPRTDFYLKKWAASSRGGFNWAAFWLSGLWLPYRKLFRATAILYVGILVESILEELLFVVWLGWTETPRWLDRGVAAAVCWLCGSLGNGWYAAHVARSISVARVAYPDEAERLAMLSRRGGTSVLAAAGAFTLFVLSMIGALALLSLLTPEG